MINISLVVSASAAITYVLDTHGGNTLHVFALTNFFKNMAFYGCTFFANGVVLYRGVKVTLLILAACQAFCWLLSIPMYRYGKRVRAFVSRRLAFWVFIYWRWWYWDFPTSELRSRAGSMLVYQCEISGPFERNRLLGKFQVVGGSRCWLNTRTYEMNPGLYSSSL